MVDEVFSIPCDEFYLYDFQSRGRQKEQLLVDRRSKNAEPKRVGGEIGGDLP